MSKWGPSTTACNKQVSEQTLYHVNLQKKLIEPGPAVSVFVSYVPDPREHILVQRDLTPPQTKDLTDLLDRFAEVFTSSPRVTRLVHHSYQGGGKET